MKIKNTNQEQIYFSFNYKIILRIKQYLKIDKI
jgi:hypothetical protein